MKPFCVVDTSSLIYMSGVELGKRTLYQWLWSEFEVRYSAAVLEEIRRHQDKVRDRRRWEAYVWPDAAITSYEAAIFGRSISRNVQAGECRLCGQMRWRTQSFQPDLSSELNRGERHNCCVAVEAVVRGRQSQVFFVTEDTRATRDYVDDLFDIFQFGRVWNALDLVIYLFVRYRRRIPPEEAEAALRDLNAARFRTALGAANEQVRAALVTERTRRLTSYHSRVRRINDILISAGGIS